MNIFADTSGFFALLVHNDHMHVRARLNFEYFAENNARLLSSSYVLLETLTLLQRRIGLESVWDFNAKIVPLLDIVWVDESWHNRALQRLQLNSRRNLSLTDCLSFEIMEAQEITIAFTFDSHFEEQGFTIAAFHDLSDPGKD
jgi:predicted nucleic acid-binding protein